MTRAFAVAAIVLAARAVWAQPAGSAAAAPPAKPGVVDMTEADDEPLDAPVEAQTLTDKHPSLVPCKYTGGCETHGGELDDPFAAKPERVPIAPPAWQLGVFAGASAAYHRGPGGGGRAGTGGSRIAPEAALDARVHAGNVPHVGPGAVDVRLDWSRRGGDDGRFDAFGASASYDLVVFAPRAAWLSVQAGVRGELRTGDAMLATSTNVGGAASPQAMRSAIERAGLGSTAAVELAIRRIPITIAARYDQDLTELAPGVRERAFVVEIGGAFRAGLRY